MSSLPRCLLRQRRHLPKQAHRCCCCLSPLIYLHRYQNNTNRHSIVAWHSSHTTPSGFRNDPPPTFRQSTGPFHGPTPSHHHQAKARNVWHEVQPYLDQEAFPVGSFNSKVVAKFVKSIKQLAAMATPESVRFAFELLDRLCLEFEQQNNNDHSTSSDHSKRRITFGRSYETEAYSFPSRLIHDVVKAWRLCWMDTKSTDWSARQVFDKLCRWESLPSESRPGVFSYNMVIYVAANCRNPDLAEEILHHLQESNKGELQVFPNIFTFNGVIDAWSKSGRPNAPQKAEELLAEMIGLHDVGWQELCPDVVAYSTVICAWANSNQEKAPERTEELLYEMQHRGLVPDTVSYLGVLTAWARSHGNDNDDKAPKRAHAILKHMISLYETGIEEAKPNAPCYSTVISAYASRGNVLEAEHLLMEQLETFQTTEDEDFRPDNYGFNSVIHAWSKSGRPEAPRMAEAILQRMHDLAQSAPSQGEGSSSSSAAAAALRPNVVSFNSVLSAWAQSNEVDAPDHCEKILQRMQDLHRNGIADCQPDAFSFNTVLDCWAKSSKEQAAERAEAILYQMAQQPTDDDDGTTTVKPNVISYNSVMNAWLRSGLTQAPDRAQALFDDMIRQSQAGDRDLQPDSTTFGTLMAAWFRSSRKDGAAKAQVVFDTMMVRYRNGDLSLKPNVVKYNGLMDAWSKAGEPIRAEIVLRELVSNASLGLKPTSFAYNTVMYAWVRSGVPHAAERAQALYDEMTGKYKAGDEDVKPSTQTFGTLITAWARSKRKDRAARAHAVLDDMLEYYKAGDATLKPDIVKYNSLLDVCAKASQPERAEIILRGMETNELVGVKPDVRSYSIVINAWARSGLGHAADRAQALFDEMTQKHKIGERELKPTAQTFGTLISTWGRSNRKDGAVKAQFIFDDMMTKYRDGDLDRKPGAIEVNALINAWAKTGSPERAEAILREMESLVGVKPDVISYSTVMTAWTRSGHPDKAQRAQLLYDEMIQKYKAGDKGVKPGPPAFEVLISAWCESGQPDAIQKAQVVLDDMLARFRSGEVELEPSVEKLCAMMDAVKTNDRTSQ